MPSWVEILKEVVSLRKPRVSGSRHKRSQEASRCRDPGTCFMHVASVKERVRLQWILRIQGWPVLLLYRLNSELRP